MKDRERDLWEEADPYKSFWDRFERSELIGAVKMSPATSPQNLDAKKPCSPVSSPNNKNQELKSDLPIEANVIFNSTYAASIDEQKALDRADAQKENLHATPWLDGIENKIYYELKAIKPGPVFYQVGQQTVIGDGILPLWEQYAAHLTKTHVSASRFPILFFEPSITDRSSFIFYRDKPAKPPAPPITLYNLLFFYGRRQIQTNPQPTCALYKDLEGPTYPEYKPEDFKPR